MANILGVNIESPQERQERLLKQQLATLKTMQNPTQQFGYNLAMALSQSFGGLKKQREATETRLKEMTDAEQDGRRKVAIEEQNTMKAAQAEQIRQHFARMESEGQIAPGQGAEMAAQAATQSAQAIDQQSSQMLQQEAQTDVQRAYDHYSQKEDFDPLRAKQYARADAALRLRKLGDPESLKLAQQLSDMNTQEMVQSRDAELKRNNFKADTAVKQAQVESANRNQLVAKTIGELETRRELMQQRGEDTEEITAIIEDKKTKGYIPVDGLDAERLGLTPEQLAKIQTPYGLPKDTVKLLLEQKRLSLVDEAAEAKRNQLPNTSIKQLEKSAESSFTAANNARQAARLRSEVESVARLAGVAGSGQKIYDTLFGADKDRVQVRAELSGLLLGEALRNKPPGPISEGELKILLDTVVDANADANQIAEALYKIEIANRYAEEYELAKANWMSPKSEENPTGGHRTLGGFTQHWRGQQESVYSQLQKDNPYTPMKDEASPPPGETVTPDGIIVGAPVPVGNQVRLQDGTIITPREQ
jgi:hypothetical protein